MPELSQGDRSAPVLLINFGKPRLEVKRTLCL
jgi:hypothetical protein